MHVCQGGPDLFKLHGSALVHFLVHLILNFQFLICVVWPVLSFTCKILIFPFTSVVGS